MARLTNPLATVEQLYRRSVSSSLPQDVLEVVFFTTQCLTQAAGLLLELPQSVTAQANVILARYWLIESPMADEFSDVSAASIYLVAKMSASPRSPRDVSNVYAYLASPSSPFLRPQDPTTHTHDDPASYHGAEDSHDDFCRRLLALEARILAALSFDVHVALPHGLAVIYLQTLDFFAHGVGTESEAAARQRLALGATEYLNTALLSPQMLYLTHQPHALAAAAVYGAARDAGAASVACAWWEALDVDREELGFLVVAMRSLAGWMGVRRGQMAGLWEGGMVRRKGVEEELERRAGGEG